MIRHLIAATPLAALGCGGVADTADEDHRIIQIVTNHNMDGTVTNEYIPLGIDPNWATQDTDIDGPWFHQGESAVNSAGELGQTAQAITYGLNSKYGTLLPAPNSSDKRCPNTWSSSQSCQVSGTKAFRWLFYPSALDASDGVPGWLYKEWSEALPVMSKGGFTHCNGGFCSDPLNSWIDNTDGECSVTAHACTYQLAGAAFTHNGLKFRKTVPGNQNGWNAGFPAWAAINIEPTKISNMVQLYTLDPAKQGNFLQNILEHELGHANGLADDPNGDIMIGFAHSGMVNDPGPSLKTQQVLGMTSYTP